MSDYHGAGHLSVGPIWKLKGKPIIPEINFETPEDHTGRLNPKGWYHTFTFPEMTCSNCGATVTTDHPHEETVMCSECGAVNKNRVTKCDICGNPVDLQLKYSMSECPERGMTYAVPLKVTFRLFVYDKDPETGARMGIWGLKATEQFDWSRTIARLGRMSPCRSRQR